MGGQKDDGGRRREEEVNGEDSDNYCDANDGAEDGRPEDEAAENLEGKRGDTRERVFGFWI